MDIRKINAISISFSIIIISLIATKLTGYQISWVVLILTSLWAAIDSSQIQLIKYKSSIPYSPFKLFYSCLLFWIVTFPLYIEIRNKIVKGLVEQRVFDGLDDSKTTEVEYGRPKPLAYLGILVSSVFFLFALLGPGINLKKRLIFLLVSLVSAWASSKFRYVAGEERKKQKLTWHSIFELVAFTILAIFICFVTLILVVKIALDFKGVKL